jgi:hypothetical protein
MSQGSAKQHRGSWLPEDRARPRDDSGRRVTWHHEPTGAILPGRSPG